MAARRRKRWKTILPTVTLTAIPFVVNMPVANAFFPPIVPPTPGIVVPPVSPPPFVPPVVPPVIVPPVIVPPVVPPVCVGDPHCVPEPATIVTAALGLAALAGYGRVTRKERREEGDASK